MPKQTFYKLPQEKQERILAAAKKEFTQVRYNDASINQIVREAGIPRGSFYQYFDDKDDLFDYIVAREDAKNLKPAPDAYLKTLEYLNLSPTEAIAMEDSKRGVEAAKSCNIKTVKVDNFTVIKYNIDGIIEEEFANKYLKKLLMNNESHF